MLNCFRCGACVGPHDHTCRECQFPTGLSANLDDLERVTPCAFAPVWQEPGLPASFLVGFIAFLMALSFLSQNL